MVVVMAHESASPPTEQGERTVSTEHTLTSEDADEIRDTELEAEQEAQRKLAAGYDRKTRLSRGLGLVAAPAYAATVALWIAYSRHPQDAVISWIFVGVLAVYVVTFLAHLFISPSTDQTKAHYAAERAKLDAEVAWRVDMEVSLREHKRVMAEINERSEKSRIEHERFMETLRDSYPSDEADAEEMTGR
jgi:hypothetical protein